MGHSIGMWEGDTLVVDSIGFNDKSWLGANSLAHTANMRIRERWTRTTMGTMTVELMYEDPEMFVKPWKVVLTLFLAPGENLMENICENNKFRSSQRGRIHESRPSSGGRADGPAESDAFPPRCLPICVGGVAYRHRKPNTSFSILPAFQRSGPERGLSVGRGSRARFLPHRCRRGHRTCHRGRDGRSRGPTRSPTARRAARCDICTSHDGAFASITISRKPFRLLVSR